MFKNSHILYLLEKFHQGACSPEETDMLNNWYEKLLVPDFEEKLWLENDPETIKKVRQQLKQLKLKVAKEDKKTKPLIIHFGWIWKAAIILLLIGGGIFFWSRDDRANHPKEVAVQKKEKEIKPGSNAGVLTLADGTTIPLDSIATSGELAKQGVATILNNKSQLSYVAEENSDQLIYNTITTQQAQNYSLKLSDGTVVWLNASSSLRFPVSFVGNERTVEVTGEVYFEVAKNATKPFHVKANGMDIKVLGTHFNVNTYGDEPYSKITLSEGSVEVTKNDIQQRLKPGQQAQVLQSGKINIRKVDIEEALAWKNGYFIFHEENIVEILRQFARWYNVELIIKGKIPNKTFEAKLPRSLTLNQIVDILNIYQFKSKIVNNKLIIE